MALPTWGAIPCAYKSVGRLEGGSVEVPSPVEGLSKTRVLRSREMGAFGVVEPDPPTVLCGPHGLRGSEHPI